MRRGLLIREICAKYARFSGLNIRCKVCKVSILIISLSWPMYLGIIWGIHADAPTNPIGVLAKHTNWCVGGASAQMPQIPTCYTSQGLGNCPSPQPPASADFSTPFYNSKGEMVVLETVGLRV